MVSYLCTPKTNPSELGALRRRKGGSNREAITVRKVEKKWFTCMKALESAVAGRDVNSGEGKMFFE